MGLARSRAPCVLPAHSCAERLACRVSGAKCVSVSAMATHPLRFLDGVLGVTSRMPVVRLQRSGEARPHLVASECRGRGACGYSDGCCDCNCRRRCLVCCRFKALRKRPQLEAGDRSSKSHGIVLRRRSKQHAFCARSPVLHKDAVGPASAQRVHCARCRRAARQRGGVRASGANRRSAMWTPCAELAHLIAPLTECCCMPGITRG